MIIFSNGTNGRQFAESPPFGFRVIYWKKYRPVYIPVQPLWRYPFPWNTGFDGRVIWWRNRHGSYTGQLSTGNLKFIYTGNSTSQGTVQAYNDGVINVALTLINASASQFPVVLACISILNQTAGVAKPYKLDVIKNGTTLFTVRSVYWGSQWNLGDLPNYILIDQQTGGGSSQVA